MDLVMISIITISANLMVEIAVAQMSGKIIAWNVNVWKQRVQLIVTLVKFGVKIKHEEINVILEN